MFSISVLTSPNSDATSVSSAFSSFLRTATSFCRVLNSSISAYAASASALLAFTISVSASIASSNSVSLACKAVRAVEISLNSLSTSALFASSSSTRELSGFEFFRVSSSVSSASAREERAVIRLPRSPLAIFSSSKVCLIDAISAFISPNSVSICVLNTLYSALNVS